MKLRIIVFIAASMLTFNAQATGPGASGGLGGLGALTFSGSSSGSSSRTTSFTTLSGNLLSRSRATASSANLVSGIGSLDGLGRVAGRGALPGLPDFNLNSSAQFTNSVQGSIGRLTFARNLAAQSVFDLARSDGSIVGSLSNSLQGASSFQFNGLRQLSGASSFARTSVFTTSLHNAASMLAAIPAQ